MGNQYLLCIFQAELVAKIVKEQENTERRDAPDSKMLEPSLLLAA